MLFRTYQLELATLLTSYSRRLLHTKRNRKTAPMCSIQTDDTTIELTTDLTITEPTTVTPALLVLIDHTTDTAVWNASFARRKAADHGNTRRRSGTLRRLDISQSSVIDLILIPTTSIDVSDSLLSISKEVTLTTKPTLIQPLKLC